ncbi:MAG: hypothetical protein BWX88_03591 [Planctomycetes bacterium ADurb.Bin126]|nr:MAG: hypothetical protein BWX88_03591 [Planctomycetes bacterium ADurb.Bin126]HQL73854.1 hypothetical protein [Phycisphaerae bacterium]
MTRKQYDDDVLIDDLVLGRLGLSQIAAKHGISRRQLYRILMGDSRPALKARIDLACHMADLELRRFAAGLLPDLLRLHLREATEGSGPEARRCREFLMKLAVGGPLQPPIVSDPLPEDHHKLSLRTHLQQVRRRLRMLPKDSPDDE